MATDQEILTRIQYHGRTKTFGTVPKETAEDKLRKFSMVPKDILDIFCGFFFGEGCIYIASRKPQKGDKVTYWVCLSVAQRIDNLDTLLFLQKKFGGNFCSSLDHVVGKTGKKHYRSAWQLTSKTMVKCLLQCLLDSPFPHNKKEEAQVALDFLSITPDKGTNYSSESRAKRLSLYHKFKQVREDHKVVSQFKYGYYGDTFCGRN